MTEIVTLEFSKGYGLTEGMIVDGAPALPEGFTYRLHIKHSTLTQGGTPTAPEVTAKIGSFIGDEWVEVARYTEVTRADLRMATVAAAFHAYEVWGQ